MKCSRGKLVLIISGISMVLMACSLFGGQTGANGEGDKYLGEEYSSKGGGFFHSESEGV